MKKTIVLSFIFIALLAGVVSAQVDTVTINNKRLITSSLKQGITQYLIYSQNINKKKNLKLSFWVREIRLSPKDGKKVFIIDQHWFGVDTSRYFRIFSINDANSFAPIYHSETALDTTYAYNWYADHINGADTVNNNPQKSFLLKFTSPNFNWNLDIETLEMLPLDEHKSFAINFYDAGLDPPKYVIYKVEGSEVITTLNEEKVDCWKLITEGDVSGHHYKETYWISKNKHQFLKEEDELPGGYRYKVRMPASLPDIIGRFAK